ncbi:MAG: indolepyruvate oxidoreductase subunit beta family protein [Betaproteobacteria bacterium]|nr:MAG: indolepyruvate oxidoreductase subunit beta family protein [Betaproteobacteria bacterium]
MNPISILICALGGEGGGVLSEWLVDAAQHAGHPMQSTFPQPLSALGGRRPVMSLYPVPGGLDLLVSSELLETVRQIGNGMATPQRTQVISSSSRTLTTHERMQLGDGRVDSEQLADVVRQYSREHHLLDMSAVTRDCGTVVSAVMFGAIAASGALPFGREHCEAAIRAAGKGAEASLRGFARAFDIVAGARAHTAFVDGVLAVEAPALPAELAARFPAAVHEMLALGHARVLEYQDRAYAALYVQRLQRVLDAERSTSPQGANAWATTREAARWLALWMAFDDIVRVAQLKSRASRMQRVKREVKLRDGQLLRLYDHFKPGVPEFAALLPPRLADALLPPRLADALLRWDRRRREPFALPLKLGTHGVFGMLALRLLAACTRLRRHGSRFAQEQALIERWLAALEQGARQQWALGHELAQCGRLIKGYGSTNERGKDNLLHIVDHLAGDPEAVRSARAAALADEAGTALDQTLRAHGAPPRPVSEQPIRWMARRPGSLSTTSTGDTR